LEEYLKEDGEILWCLHDLKVVNIKKVTKGLWEGTAMAVCDGSFKEKFKEDTCLTQLEATC
jgi:hypothetical protein